MKSCKLCLKEKNIEEFYVHKMMTDGHLNFCKDCKRKYQREKSRSPEGRAYDHLRFSTPKRRTWLLKYNVLRRKKDPLKFSARNILMKAVYGGKIKRLPCSVCGEMKVEGHHPDYSKPLEVVWLCPLHHRSVHQQYQRKY